MNSFITNPYNKISPEDIVVGHYGGVSGNNPFEETVFKPFEESKLFKYYACSDGYILRVLKSNFNKEEKVSVYNRRGVAYCKVNQKDVAVKKIIFKTFCPSFKEGSIIVNVDGNIFNCRLSNLKVITKREQGIRTGGRGNNIPITVTYPNGKVNSFPSVRVAAKKLHCSYQCLLDYMKGTNKHSVLDGYIITKNMEVQK